MPISTTSLPAAVAILGLGWLGLPLAWQLHQHGVRIRAARRTPDQTLPFAVTACDIGRSDCDDWLAWADCPVWLCLLPPSGSPDYVAGIERWLAAARHCGVKHVLYSSSISVYGQQRGRCTEHTPIAPASDNAAKVAAVEALFASSDIPHRDVLRLGGLYGAQRHPIHTLLRRTRNPGAAQPTNMLSQTEAVAALLLAITRPQGWRLRNIVSPQHPTKRAFYTAEAQRLRVPAPDFDPADSAADGKIVASAYHDFDPIFHSLV